MATADALPHTLLALDSDVFTDWRNQRAHTVGAIRDYQVRVKLLPKLTAMMVFEAHAGFEQKRARSGFLDERTEQSRLKMERFIQLCGVLKIETKTASLAAYIFSRLSQRDRNKNWRDVFIAATALAHGYGVATRNKSDFESIGEQLPPNAPILYLAIWKP
jgi:predicted nucleic acid-binding protein